MAYFTSFAFPVMIEDDDVDMIEDVLSTMDLENGLALLINSPGGDGLASERLINVLRSYSKTGTYDAYIIGKAKSAATLACFGAETIYMCKTAELGPVDPQVTFIDSETNRPKRFSVCNLVKSYENLFERAVKEKGNLQPYLQQLSHYDEREIEEYRAAIFLSEDISIRSLKSGMFKSLADKTIKNKIKMFLTPEETKSHGRPIYFNETKKAGLNVKEIHNDDELWRYLFELYTRIDQYTKTIVAKCIENKKESFLVGISD